MQHVEVLFYQLQVTLRIFRFEPRFFSLTVDAHQSRTKLQVDCIALDVFHQWGHEGGNTEKNSASIIEFDMNIF